MADRMFKKDGLLLAACLRVTTPAWRLSILVKSQRAGERVMESVRKYPTHKLKLTVNEDKTQVAHTWTRMPG